MNNFIYILCYPKKVNDFKVESFEILFPFLLSVLLFFYGNQYLFTGIAKDYPIFIMMVRGIGVIVYSFLVVGIFSLTYQKIGGIFDILLLRIFLYTLVIFYLSKQILLICPKVNYFSFIIAFIIIFTELIAIYYLFGLKKKGISFSSFLKKVIIGKQDLHNFQLSISFYLIISISSIFYLNFISFLSIF